MDLLKHIVIFYGLFDGSMSRMSVERLVRLGAHNLLKFERGCSVMGFCYAQETGQRVLRVIKWLKGRVCYSLVDVLYIQGYGPYVDNNIHKRYLQI